MAASALFFFGKKPVAKRVPATDPPIKIRTTKTITMILTSGPFFFSSPSPSTGASGAAAAAMLFPYLKLTLAFNQTRTSNPSAPPVLLAATVGVDVVTVFAISPLADPRFPCCCCWLGVEFPPFWRSCLLLTSM